MVFNVLESPFLYSKWMRNQIMVKHNRSGYSITTLLYVADSTYYSTKSISPNKDNFTGAIIELDFEKRTSISYMLEEGIIISINKEIKYRDDTEVWPWDGWDDDDSSNGADSEGCSYGPSRWTRFWGRLGHKPSRN